MPLDFDAFETHTSRPTKWTSDGGAKTQNYTVKVTGYTTPEEAANYAIVSGELPTFIPFNPVTLDPPMTLKGVSADPDESPEIWTITGDYKALVVDDSGNEIQWTFSGTTSGATQTVTQGIAYRSYGTGPNYNGAINVDKDGVQGVEIVIPKLEFQIEKIMPKGTLWFAHLMKLLRLTGRVNASDIWGFAAGELLYLGADFSQKGGGDVTYTHKFTASPNRLTSTSTALTIGSITNVEKYGHEYLWIDYKAEESGGFVVRTPRTVHVHQVYDTADFNELEI